MKRKLPKKIDPVQLSAILLGLVALIVFLVGAFNIHKGLELGPLLNNLLEDFYANISSEIGGILITVFIIDRLNQHREIQREKTRLIRDMGGRDNVFALRAVRELKAENWLYDATLRGVDLSNANLQNINLQNANLEETNLQKTNLKLSDLSGANLHTANLHNSDLENANLRFANLYRANLSMANLRMATLWGSNLKYASLRKACMQNVDLSQAELEHTDLGGADLQNANLQGANLHKAILVGTDLRDAVVTDEQLAQARMLRHAIMPDGSLYDGRFHLAGDIEVARANGVELDLSTKTNWYSGH